MNGNMKIGKRELEIIEYLQERGKRSYAQVLVDFSPTVYLPTGKMYYQYDVVIRRLQRMLKKGLIIIEKGGLKNVKLSTEQ